MDIHDFYRYPWMSMDIHGYPWISMDVTGYPMDIHGLPVRSGLFPRTVVNLCVKPPELDKGFLEFTVQIVFASVPLWGRRRAERGCPIGTGAGCPPTHLKQMQSHLAVARTPLPNVIA